MKSNTIIIDVFWDKRLVKDELGNQFEIFRGKDYETDWEKLGYGYAKDKTKIYKYDKVVFKEYYSNIDFDTFRIVEGYTEKSKYNPANENVKTVYFADKNKVYIDGYCEGISVIEGIHPKDFKIIDIKNEYVTNGKEDFVFNRKLPYRLKDMETINSVYVKSNGTVYFWNTNVVASCDTNSFELVNDAVINIAKDKNHVYYKDKIIEGANPETFHFLEGCINTNRTYYQNWDIDFYAKDKRHAYFISTPFHVKVLKTNSLDNFRFKVIDKKGYAFDNTYQYYRGVRKKI